MISTPTCLFVPCRGLAWLCLALLPVVAMAADEPQETGAERTYVVGHATIQWKLDASRVPAATRERAVRMAKTFTGVGQPEAKDRQDEEVEAKVLPDGKRQARVPAYLMNAAILRFGPEPQLVCVDRPQEPAAAVSSSLEGVR